MSGFYFLGLISDDLFCSFDWTIFPPPPFFFVCHVIFFPFESWIFEKTATSPNLYRTVLYKARTFQSDWPEILGTSQTFPRNSCSVGLCRYFPNKKGLLAYYLGACNHLLRLRRWLSAKESACSAWDTGWIPGSGRSPGEGNCNLCQYSWLGNPMDREIWWATAHVVAKELDMT